MGGNIELTGEGGRSCSVVCVRAAAVRVGGVEGADWRGRKELFGSLCQGCSCAGWRR